MIICENCTKLFPPTACRWRCPGCGYKESCCEGEPQQQRTLDPRTLSRVYWERGVEGPSA